MIITNLTLAKPLRTRLENAVMAVVCALQPIPKRGARSRGVLLRVALSVGETLVTNNAVDFNGYPGLVVENWALAA